MFFDLFVVVVVFFFKDRKLTKIQASFLMIKSQKYEIRNKWPGNLVQEIPYSVAHSIYLQSKRTSQTTQQTNKPKKY